MHLSVVGLSHKTAPLDIRERLAHAPQVGAAHTEDDIARRVAAARRAFDETR